MDVKDADAIVVNYHDGYQWWTAVVDAGNVGDANKVKVYVKHKENNKYVIDYAFCTHPDKDHKGGFFDLLTDSQVEICNFFIRRPDILMRNDIRRLQYNVGELERAAKAVYNHPTDEGTEKPPLFPFYRRGQTSLSGVYEAFWLRCVVRVKSKNRPREGLGTLPNGFLGDVLADM